MAHLVDMGVRLKLEGVAAASDYLTKTMSEQKGGRFGGSVTLLRPDGSPYPGSPFTGGGLPGLGPLAVDGNDNVWISNFATPNSPIVQLCGVRTENCPPGMKTGDQISPPGGYVGGGLQMQTDIAVDPAGNVWAMNNWQDIDSCIAQAQRGAFDPLRRPGRRDLLRHGQAGAVRRRSGRRSRGETFKIARKDPVMKPRKFALLAALFMATAFSGLAPARSEPGDDAAGQSASDLAKKLQNPIGDLYSFPFQGNTNFGVGPHSGTQEILNVQPVIPFHVSDDWNIITRTILPLVWNPDMSPLPSTAFGTGAHDLFSLPVAAQPDRRLALGRRPGGADPDRHLANARLQRLGRRRDRRPRLHEGAMGRGRAGQ